MMRGIYFLFFSGMLSVGLIAQPINRKALVERHQVVIHQYDSLGSLSVGNGRFAFTVDVTGLQSFPQAYAYGVPLGTQSEWGWHRFPNPSGFRFEETLQPVKQYGRAILYSTQVKEPKRTAAAIDWYRQNPHRLQLGNLGLELIKKDGGVATIQDIKNIHQTLNPFTGEIHSRFTIEQVPVELFTCCHSKQDLIAISIHSPLLKEGRLKIRLQFPYPTNEFKDAAVNYLHPDQHHSTCIPMDHGALIKREMDATRYFTAMHWRGDAQIKERKAHEFVLSPAASERFDLVTRFSEKESALEMPDFLETKLNSALYWKKFWMSGAAVDFSETKDPRAFELERRVILSQYLTKIQCSGAYPPQETGLTFNSWYGRPHLEMHWWHGIHFAQWGRIEELEKSLGWYKDVFGIARNIAARQGFEGVRWQKMTDNDGNESPSSVGAFLIWQEPHIIYFSELCYRAHQDQATLKKYKDLVFATADFMASFAAFDSLQQRYVLGKGIIPAQEKFRASETLNPAYELVYWRWALFAAVSWAERMHLPVHPKWKEVAEKMASLAIQDDKYLFTESGTDSYTNPEYRSDHPSVLGALGMLPASLLVNQKIMGNSFDWIWKNWNWKDTWGWDYPMVAMTATRLGRPEQAVEALLMPVQKNTYLVNGHNFQDPRLTIYLPGNGGLLAAVAMMCAGYDGCTKDHPGIPNGWKVKWEGLKKMP